MVVQVGIKHHLLATTNLSLGCQLKSPEEYRETRIAHMDQTRTSNRSSAIKNNDLTSIHQSPINLKYPHVFFIRNQCTQSWKKGHQSKRVDILTDVPKIEKYRISQKRDSFLIGRFFGQRTCYDTYVHLTHVIIKFINTMKYDGL